MPKIMALDVGDKTVGVAVSDELGITATPLTVIARTASIKADVRAVEALIKEQGVEKVVAGLPVMLDGSIGVQAGKVMEFCERLARRLIIPLEFWDERLSTLEAERAMIEADVRREKRKKVIDKLAATLILQSYLRAHS